MYAYTRLEMEMYILYVYTHLCEYIRYYCVIIIRDVLVQHTLQHTHCNTHCNTASNTATRRVQHTLQHTHCNTHCNNRYYCVIIIREVLLVLFRYTHILLIYVFTFTV